MHEKIKDFLDTQQSLEQKELEKEKKKILRELGLFEKIYSSEPNRSREFPYYDEDCKKFYKRVCFDVTDEEFEKIKKYYIPKPELEIKQNPIYKILKVIAWISYISTFIAGLIFIQQFVLTLIFWLLGFISGSFILGFAEIVKLLDNINDKID